MINVPFDDIDAETIQGLLDNEVMEQRTLDYKRELHLDKAEEKKEFLADVSSFANAGGGHLIYGIAEEKGQPVEIPGFPLENPDKTILRLESMVRDGIDPPIPGVRLKIVAGWPEGPVIVMSIPKSWAGPHMVTYRGSSRFYSRTSASKEKLDVRGIRAAFAMSEELPRRIQRFRDERLGRIISNEGAIPMRPGGKIIMHLVPVTSVEGTVCLDAMTMIDKTQSVRVFGHSGHNDRLNLNGWLKYARQGGCGIGMSYVQFFRNGAVEAVNATRLGPHESRNPYSDATPGSPQSLHSIHSPEVEPVVISTLRGLVDYLREVNTEPPVFLFVTFTGVRGATVIGSDRINGEVGSHTQDYLIDDDVLILPEIQIDDLTEKPDVIIRPVLDALWQASGYAYCANYDADGNWQGN